MTERLGEFSLIYSNAVVIDEQGCVLNESELEFLNVPAIYGYPLFYLLGGNSISGHNMLVTRELIDAAIPFDSEIMFDQWLSIVACLKGGITFLAQVLAEHRMHGNNALNNVNLNKLNKMPSVRLPKIVKIRETASRNSVVLKRLIAMGSKHTHSTEFVNIYLDHFLKIKQCFFNFKLYRFLNNIKDESFINLPEKKINKHLRRMCRGELYYRIFNFHETILR